MERWMVLNGWMEGCRNRCVDVGREGEMEERKKKGWMDGRKNFG